MNNLENMNYPIPKQEYKVLVRCHTYNQSKYIEDALNSFAMQQTNFPFVCLVMDDASTDNEQKVIKEWIQCECDMSKAETIDIPTSIVIIVPHKKNLFCTFAFYLLKQNLYGTGDKKMNHIHPWREKCEYEAICEGDDYWIDPLKLHKQIDFMEKNQNYSMCFHNAFVSIIKNGKRTSQIFNDANKDYDLTFEAAISKWHVPTASMLVRKKARENFPDYIKKIYSGDIALILVLLLRGKARYLNDVMSVYRKVEGNASVSQSVKKSFYFKQISMLYESFLKAPELTKETKDFIIKHVKHDKLLYKYHVIKENKEYYKFINPIFWRLLSQKALSKLLY